MKITLAIICFTCFHYACTPFNYGLTEEKARDRYTMVDDKNTYGVKRMGHVKKFYANSQLAYFLDKKGNPSFFYEYKTDTKCRGIRLYYSEADSAFIFEEPSKGDLSIYLKEARKMNGYERETYGRIRLNQ